MKRSAVLCAALAGGLVLPASAYPHGTPDQVNDPPSTNSAACDLGASLFQSFAPSRRLLLAIDLRFRAGSSFPANGLAVPIRIHAGSPGGAISGETTAFVPGPRSGGESLLVHFDFSQPIALDPRGPFVIEYFGVSPLDLSWSFNIDNPYPAGASYPNCSGAGGPSSATLDFNFVTFIPADAAEPETSITAGPLEAAVTRARSAAIAFAGTDDLSYASNLTFTCGIDRGAASSCASRATFVGLRDGPHTFRVQATDQAGRTDSSPAVRTWTVDTTSPNRPTVRGPRTTTRSRVTYRLSARDALTSARKLRFLCALDSRRLRPCAARYVARLSRGRHVLRVAARDKAGNTSATVAVGIRRR
jgi:hypothetical protein